MENGPATLLEAVQFFSEPDNCITYLAAKRWPDGIAVCPICGRKGAGFLAKQRRWQCSVRHPKRQFSIKVGTIFEDSPLPLEKWMPAMWLICSNRNGISSWELHRALDVTQKTAWFMLQRIRLAIQDEEYGGKIGGEGTTVQIDETFIGGKARNMHKDKREKAKSDVTGSFGKPSYSERSKTRARSAPKSYRIARRPLLSLSWKIRSHRGPRFTGMSTRIRGFRMKTTFIRL
jgi:transposase-like protein